MHDEYAWRANKNVAKTRKNLQRLRKILCKKVGGAYANYFRCRTRYVVSYIIKITRDVIGCNSKISF